MARKPKKSAPITELIANHRSSLGLNQTEYWGQYGVAQSAGSRYENGRRIPKPVQMLILLHLSGCVFDTDLEEVRK